MPPSRRQFGRSLALAASTGLVAAAPAADEKTPDAAEALAAFATARFGKHLTAEQLAHVATAARRHQFRSEFMKRVPIANGDGPVPDRIDER